MKAVVCPRYGPPSVLELRDVPKPTIEPDEVLVRVRASSVNQGDRHLMRGTPFLVRLMIGGLRKPGHPVLGSDVAGTVEAVGPEVRLFQPGDEVFGDLSDAGFGAFAEYAAAPESALAQKPVGTTFEGAASVALAGTAALQGLRDVGGIRAGHRVLINGASGGVGTMAVQIARSFDAEVTGVCSARNADLVRSLGAEHVVDYTREDFTRTGHSYDLILDAAAYRPVSEHLRVLAAGGSYVMVGGSTRRTFELLLLGSWRAKRQGKRAEMLMSTASADDLEMLRELLDQDVVTPVIDRSFGLDEVPDAIRYLEDGHPAGKVVVSGIGAERCGKSSAARRPRTPPPG